MSLVAPLTFSRGAIKGLAFFEGFGPCGTLRYEGCHKGLRDKNLHSFVAPLEGCHKVHCKMLQSVLVAPLTGMRGATMGHPATARGMPQLPLQRTLVAPLSIMRVPQ